MTEIELTRKQKVFAQREHDILDAALYLLNGANWQAVTVEQIAKQAEIGKGTVYKHFSSKEEIYAHITLNHYQKFTALISDIDFERDVVSCLHDLIEQCLLVSINEPAASKIAHFCKNSDFIERLPEALSIKFTAFENENDDMIYKLLSVGMERGEIPKQPAEELVLAMHACFHGILAMIWDGHVQDFDKFKQEDFIRITTRFMIAGALAYQAK
ncbi:TetR/AcrR family transcriptional regulator [Shewanella sp. 202IG2-18]|uniref:TetR/AcrR family transcriptional regulator n=1 Tax=Parashewanella hymeniacidonis TaxID=2807618 RepID=UPI00196170FF|nr:TetR/AcrR family transcriptional regulator [Parashewanella hymeniacidonis]MBM7074224.1 TetR/AcrR family transcriptional regulator [Parashewanella hymeniacidonis]